jgi:hypothetical protein
MWPTSPIAAARTTIKTGFDVRRRHLTEYQTNRGNGRFNFAPNITNNPANNAGGHVMASFLLGAPSLIEAGLPAGLGRYSRHRIQHLHCR